MTPGTAAPAPHPGASREYSRRIAQPGPCITAVEQVPVSEKIGKCETSRFAFAIGASGWRVPKPWLLALLTGHSTQSIRVPLGIDAMTGRAPAIQKQAHSGSRSTPDANRDSVVGSRAPAVCISQSMLPLCVLASCLRTMSRTVSVGRLRCGYSSGLAIRAEARLS